MKLSKTSLTRLATVHKDLSRLILAASGSTPIDFIVTEGMRTLERQKELVKAGASTTLRSRHLTGHAVDLACLIDGKLSWDWPLYYRLADHIKQVAILEKVSIEWGGDWKTFKDGPHYQLPWAKYPV